MSSPSPAVSAPETQLIAPAPRWARIAAHTITFLVLPSSLWRIGVALGLTLGYTEAGRQELVGATASGPLYLIALSVLAEGAALLALGLVHRWGVIAPQWIPRLGGRVIPRAAVLIPAWTGTALLAFLWTPLLAWWAIPHDEMTATGDVIVGLLYLPLVAWAPLMAALTVSYQRRRPKAAA